MVHVLRGVNTFQIVHGHLTSPHIVCLVSSSLGAIALEGFSNITFFYVDYAVRTLYHNYYDTVVDYTQSNTRTDTVSVSSERSCELGSII